MPPLDSPVRTLAATLVISVATAGVAGAQNTAAKSAPARSPVCAKGVRVFTEKSQVPVPFDTLRIPPAAGPVIVTSPEEAEAADLAMRGRAGSVGATGVLVTDATIDDGGGGQRISRSVLGVFVRADSARVQQACK